jgi:serine/threonine protein kinase
VHRAKKHGIEGFERAVALKRMLSHLAEDPSFVESFIREAKVASLLQHPNIAQVYDFGRINGVYYIAMELVSGFDVRKLLRYANRANESIPMPVVLSILAELCDALEYAHTFVDERGHPLNIVHRDISPSNLIVAHTGHLKVIDFGIAKASSRQLHTESGLVKGKLGYMSPEAALGMQLTPVADIFSVGVVAWELVTASPLFSSRTDYETMRRIREADIVPPSMHNPGSPSDLDRVILNALERDPDRRLPSARAFRAAIDNIAARTGIQLSARSVAEWCSQYTQPGDAWANVSAPASRKLPLPAARETPTAFAKPTRTPTRLRRSTADQQLAAEIWGDDIATSAAKMPQPDFSFQPSIATPAATQVPSVPMPVIAPAPGPAPTPPPARSSKTAPIAVVAGLALVAGVLAAYLIATNKPDTPAPATASVTFELQPAGTAITVDDKTYPAAPKVVVELAEGIHSVAAANDGFRGWASSVSVKAGEPQTIKVALEVEPDPEPVPEPVTRTAAAVKKAEPVAKKEPPAPRRERERERPRREEPRRVEPQETPPPVETPVTVAKPEPPKVEPPKPDPIKVEPPKVEPPKAPARTPAVAASAVQKISGELPTLRGSGGAASGTALVKMCIDERGAVSSVKIVKSTAEVASELSDALASWRYKPWLNAESKPSPVCFPLSLRLVFKRGD